MTKRLKKLTVVSLLLSTLSILSVFDSKMILCDNFVINFIRWMTYVFVRHLLAENRQRKEMWHMFLFLK